MRLFVAADLPRELRDRLAAIQDEGRSWPLPVRWVRPEGIHLTFKFLGEVAPDRLGAIRETLETARHTVATFQLVTAGTGSFPDHGQPQVLWIGIGGDLESATRLQAAIESALVGIGFEPEDRPYRPHLTLGRVKGPPRGEWRSAAAAGVPVPFEVGDFVLFESRHSAAGVTYFPLQRFVLDGGLA